MDNDSALKDLLAIMAKAEGIPTMTLWSLHPDVIRDEEPICDRCLDPGEWGVAMPIAGDDGDYGTTMLAITCGTCLATLVVRSEDLLSSLERPIDPDGREIWPLT